MPILFLVIVGAAAGFLATRIMRVEADVPTTIAIGVFGALLGGLVLRALVTMAGWAAGFVGAVMGALLLIWLWQKVSGRR
ncbi:MAG: GlsB/YeaQ/YmgE family stress response membrane protein [Gemmobacter sp.]|uniref:GlsB/YeaQ/YmgE family stress response membrane protein n=1 Tax=Gemmobacter sp. TaxID=1898957 RepID=UPI00391D374D